MNRPYNVVFAGDGQTAVRALALLAERDDVRVVGLWLHAAADARNGGELRALSPAAAIFEGSTVNDPTEHGRIRALNADFLISFNYAIVLREETIELFPDGNAVNMHTGLLPEQRGRYPNFWAILNGTSGGVTLHRLTKGLDEGAILAQRVVPTDWTDTAETLYRRLQDEALILLEGTISDLLAGRLAAEEQEGAYPTRRRRDFLALRMFDLDEPTTPRDFLNRLRAFEFTGDVGACFEDRGSVYSVAIKIDRLEHGLKQANPGNGTKAKFA